MPPVKGGGMEIGMKIKTMAKIFFMGLLKALLCILVIIGVGFASYKISYKVLSSQQVDDKPEKDEIQSIVEEAKTDEISKNLIFVSDAEDKLTHVILEICNTKTNNMDYVSIPVKADYTIPSVMYRKLCQVNQEIPQVIRISKWRQYFEEENDAYGYGSLVFEKMLGTDISYYTAISDETYQAQYDDVKVKVAYRGKSTADNTPDPNGDIPSSTTTIKTKCKISVCSDNYKRQMQDLMGNEEKIVEYIKNQYERVSSNLTEYNKIGYIKTYEKMNVDHFHYWGIPCTLENGVYTIDTKYAKKALKLMIENPDTYVAEQDLSKLNMITGKIETPSATPSPESSDADKTDENKSKKKIKSSKKLVLQVLNGSQIAGMAGKAKEKLEKDGFTVAKIGDYTEETLTRTKIIVRKKGFGKDLKEYFIDPKIEVGEVPEGCDILIIVGTAEANN